MSSIPQIATTLQTVLGPDLEPIGRRTGLIQRLAKRVERPMPRPGTVLGRPSEGRTL